jgi:tricorn protease
MSVRSLVLLACLAASPLPGHAADGPRAALLMHSPTLSADTIAFVTGGDLWTVARAGGEARRLTATGGAESDPAFSPDGRRIAYSSDVGGNVDVYVLPATGGEPRRLTWHPGADHVVGWTPDGADVLFRSDRDSGVGADRLWTVPAEGGWPRPLPLPEAWRGSYSPDGRRFAYMPFQRLQMAWKRYRGGETTFVWLLDLATLDVETIPRGNSNDSYPCWATDGRVYFLSDRDGPVTLERYDPATREVERVFDNDGLDLDDAQAGPGAIVFERFGAIGLYDLASGAVTFPAIHVASDLPALRPRFVPVGDQLEGADLSPNGVRAAFSAHGEILTVPAEKGSARAITHSPGAADRDPAWSPDGKTLAWLSDAGGEYALELAPSDGLGPSRTIPLGDPPSFFYRPVWSPDGARIALTDKRLQLWVVEVASGARTRVATDTYDTPERTLDPAWSPDGRYLVYTLQLPTHVHAVFVWDARGQRSTRLTDGLSDARFPVFDASGKYLWFTASTDFGPTAPWLDMTSVEHPVTRSLYLTLLAADEPSPFPPESDEAGPPDTADGGDDDSGPETGAAPPPVRLDLDGIGRRIVAAPGVPAANYRALEPGKAGEVFLLEGPEIPDADSDDGDSGPVHHYTIESRELEDLGDDVAEMHVSRDATRLLVRSSDGTWSIVDASKPFEPGDGDLATDDLEVWSDPRAEWRQMYDEVWRIERDFFYDPHHHGLDLDAAAQRYRPYLDALADRDDLDFLFTEMLGELSVGHLFVEPPEPPESDAPKDGLLGADWEIAHGRYRLARVYDGESWNPKLEAPLARPGVDARAGDYLIAVEGREVRPPASVYSFFAGTSGQVVRVRLATDPAGKDARDVTVVPVASERKLRYRAWVEDNRRLVDRLSDGRLGYLHLPNTAGAGYDSFNRYFFPQIDRQGLIVDERFNSGGLLADYIVDVLARSRPLMWVTTREGRDFPSPAGALYGPKAMLINRHAGSGGDALPWLFRERHIGPLVGTRTWGGLVGIWDYPTLLDGGAVTAPRGALYGPRGRWEVENVGVAPDVSIEITPRDYSAGRDPQLEKAVELVLDELRRSGPPKPERPPYPNYQTHPWKAEAQP